MTREERKAAFRHWLSYQGSWNGVADRFDAELDAAVEDELKISDRYCTKLTYQNDMAELRQRHAAELAKVKTDLEDNNKLWLARVQEKELELNQQYQEQSDNDQRWQERLAKLAAANLADSNENHDALKALIERHAIEIGLEKANWKSLLERVEAEHKNKLAVSDSYKEMFAGLSEKLTETVKQLCEGKSKAVAAAYEEAAKMAYDQVDDGGWLAHQIRQLAAKPQEASMSDSVAEQIKADLHPETCLYAAHKVGSPTQCPHCNAIDEAKRKFPDCECGLPKEAGPKCAQCGLPLEDTAFHDEYGCLSSKQEAHDPPPIVKSPGQAIADAVERLILSGQGDKIDKALEAAARSRPTLRSSGRIFVIDVAGIG